MLTKEQLEEAIDLYLKRNFTQYAILIDGDWGVGKTYLLNNQILPNIEGIGYFHISLFGLSTISDIENEIYKSFSIASKTEHGCFSGKEYVSPDLLKGAKLGGVSFAVQFLLTRCQDLHDGSFKLVLYFDDIERWVGDLNVCLSYVNKLVEHKNIKCILSGNLNALDEKGIQHLSKAREKTIRHIYKFENSTISRVRISLGLINYQNESSREFIHSMVENNLTVLTRFLNKINAKNIRTLSEAVQLYEYIYCNNLKQFHLSKRLSFTYFLTLLSTLTLLKKYFLHEKEKETLFSGNFKAKQGFGILKKIGYFKENAPDYITEESKLLLDTIFYRLDEISLKGIFSIIENGFYIEQDFHNNFINWADKNAYEPYLDMFHFYQLNDDEALTLIENILFTIFDDQAITNPATLLLLAERILNDIDKGVIYQDFDEIKRKFKVVIEHLYKARKMDVMDLDFLEFRSDRYPKSKDIFWFTINLNRDYIKEYEKNKQKKFWERLELLPNEIHDLMQEVSDLSFLVDIDSPDDVLYTIESLNNAQLYIFSQELLDRRFHISQLNLTRNDEKTIQDIAESLNKKYENEYGIRASNMKEIATILASF